MSNGRGRGGSIIGYHSGGGGGAGRSNLKRRNDVPNGLDPQNPVVIQFKEYAAALDKKHDKYERIAKLSRNIVIESKRVIFLLHRITSEKDTNRPHLLKEAELKLSEIRHNFWYYVAVELRGENPIKFVRAFSSGLQEYTEAIAFHYYICYEKLIQCSEVRDGLKFRYLKEDEKVTNGFHLSEDTNGKKNHDGEKKTVEIVSVDLSQMALKADQKLIDSVEKPVTSSNLGDLKHRNGLEPKTGCKENGKDKINAEDNGNATGGSKSEFLDIEVEVTMEDFILGLGDLAGEVMRLAINCIGQSDTSLCFVLLNFLHEIHSGFLKIQATNIDTGSQRIQPKIKVLEQSLRKVESACYNVNVRGKGVPEHMLQNAFANTNGR